MTLFSIIVGLPLTIEAYDQLKTWEDEGDETLFQESEATDGTHTISGFTVLNAVEDGDYPGGFCGIELCQLRDYDDMKVRELILAPTPEQWEKAEEMCSKLHPELRTLAGEVVDVFMVWHDN